MPRRTHKPAKRKHSRGHTRFQRNRMWVKRWKLAKRLYGDVTHYGYDRSTGTYNWGMTAEHPEDVLRGMAPIRGRYSGHPYNVPRNLFIDNMVTGRQCSCLLCQPDFGERGARTQREREWREIEEVAW